MGLQEQINAAVPGSTITVEGEHIGNFVINKALTLQGRAKITTPNVEPAIDIPPGVHWTGPVVLRGKSATEPLEIAASAMVYNIVRYGGNQSSLDACPQGLLVEFADIHGTAGQESQRGIAANGKNFEIRHSKVREIHGKGYDTQAICAWNGPGPFKIIDCYLEASGENVMFGGADAKIEALTPADIEIRRCHFFKPLSWKGVWTVKNLFETKNARRLVVEGNRFENNWTDGQAGSGIVIKCNNQDNTNPWAVTEDLLFQHNTIISEAGLNMLLIENPPKISAIGKRLYFRNNLWLVERLPFQGPNSGEDVQIEHNTWLSTRSSVFMLYGAPTKALKFSNNLGQHAEYGIKGDGTGEGTVALNAYSPGGWTFAGNVISSTPASQYPTGNFYPATWAEVQLGADYKLAATSPFKNKATDGKDPGVDMDALLAAQAGTTPIPPDPIPEPEPEPPTVAKYVYESRPWSTATTVAAKERNLKLLNDMGAEGWTLAEVIGAIAYFEKSVV